MLLQSSFVTCIMQFYRPQSVFSKDADPLLSRPQLVGLDASAKLGSVGRRRVDERSGHGGAVGNPTVLALADATLIPNELLDKRHVVSLSKVFVSQVVPSAVGLFLVQLGFHHRLAEAVVLEDVHRSQHGGDAEHLGDVDFKRSRGHVVVAMGRAGAVPLGGPDDTTVGGSGKHGMEGRQPMENEQSNARWPMVVPHGSAAWVHHPPPTQATETTSFIPKLLIVRSYSDELCGL